MNSADGKIIEVRNLKKFFPLSRGLFSSLLQKGPPEVIHAVNGVSFSIGHGETLGLAGESGCGKTTTAKILVRLYEPTEGEVLFKNENIAHLNGSELRRFRREAQMVFQDPYESLNPRYRIERIVGEPLIIHGFHDVADREKRIFEALHIAGLLPPEQFFDRYPHEMSGGQRQRVAIARALVLQPKLLVADEPVSMLDVSIRAGILNLLRRLTKEMDLASLYISHDLSLIRYICDRTGIMYLGRIVEMGPTEQVILRPQHPYTKKLLEAVPIPDPEYRRSSTEMKGEVPSAVSLPTGCIYHPRCDKVMKACSREPPRAVEIQPDHFVECHLY